MGISFVQINLDGISSQRIEEVVKRQHMDREEK